MKNSLIQLPFLIFILSITLFLFYSCTKKENISDQNQAFSAIKLSQGLNFTSPNGDIIAHNSDDFKKILIRSFSSGVPEGFEVTNISFKDVPVGYAAIIEYKTTLRSYNILAITNYKKLKYAPNSIQKKNLEGDSTIITFKCVGDSCCRVQGTITQDSITFGCSCNPCELIVSRQ